jgi:hypothetical protein
LPRSRHTHRVAADRMPFEDEATDEIGRRQGRLLLSRLTSFSEAH